MQEKNLDDPIWPCDGLVCYPAGAAASAQQRETAVADCDSKTISDRAKNCAYAINSKSNTQTFFLWITCVWEKCNVSPLRLCAHGDRVRFVCLTHQASHKLVSTSLFCRCRFSSSTQCVCFLFFCFSFIIISSNSSNENMFHYVKLNGICICLNAILCWRIYDVRCKGNHFCGVQYAFDGNRNCLTAIVPALQPS